MLAKLLVSAWPTLTNVRPLQRVWHLEVPNIVKRLSRKLWRTTLATPSTASTSQSAIGCRMGRRQILLKDDSTPHEWCRPTRRWLQVHRPHRRVIIMR